MKSSVRRALLATALLLTPLAARAEGPFTISPRVEAPQGRAVMRVQFGVPQRHFLYADKLSLTVRGSTHAARFSLPEPTLELDRFSGQQKRVYTNSFEAAWPLADTPLEGLTLSIHYQGCDEANCYFPEERVFRFRASGAFEEIETDDDPATEADPNGWRQLADGFGVQARGSGYLNEKAFLGFLEGAQDGQSSSALTPEDGSGWKAFSSLLLILLGGLALNLTPCILPMIPINLAILGAGAQAGSRSRGFLIGATYGGGMAVAYGVLGLAVVLTGSRFGTLNASPWFNLIIAAVFAVLALAMFDRINLDLSRFQRQGPARTAQGVGQFLMAYVMGTIAALLAGACVAPVVITVLLQATALYSHGATAGLALPFVLGLGMALPWPFAGAGLSFLPKPGKWMMRVKCGFGVVIALLGIYYGYLAVELFRSSSQSVTALAGHSGESAGRAPLGTELAEALSAARLEGKPLFIDFWATWCKNCSAMEHTTFRNPRVVERLQRYHQLKLQAEQPEEPATKEVLDYFKVLGLPTYVVLVPKANPPVSPNRASFAPPEPKTSGSGS